MIADTLAQLATEIAELESLITTLTAQRDAALAQADGTLIASLNAQVESLSNQVATLIVERNEALATLAPLNQQLSDANGALATAQQQLAGYPDLMSRVTQLEAQLATAITERDDALAEIVRLNTGLDTLQGQQPPQQ